MQRVKSIIYNLPSTLQIDFFETHFLRADEAVSRLDERVKISKIYETPITEGWQTRMLYREACACRLAAGEFVHLEDLVLLDNGALNTGMTPDLSNAWFTLGVLRHAGKSDPNALLLSERPGERIDSPMKLTDPPDYFYDPNWDEEGRLARWRGVMRRTHSMPPLLAAAIAWDAWLELEPDQRGAWRAGLIAALVLKARAKTRHLLLPVDTGQRFSRYRRHVNHDLNARLAGFMEWILEAAERGNKELDTLTVAARLLRAKLKGRRKNSRLPALADLLLSRPLVSVPMAAKALRCSSQAVEAMLPLLGSTPRELTGRGRYRAWGIV